MSIASSTIAQFEYPRQVRFVDTDASGFANFSAYVRMMEETEYAFLRNRGLCVILRDEKGTMGFPRLNVSLKIHQPLVFEQEVTVRLLLVEIDGKQVVYKFEILDHDQDVLVEGSFKVAFCRFPDNEPPFAILIPEFVTAALTGNGS